MTRRIRDLRNLGPATERLLATVGITTPDDLHQAGAVDAYQRLVDTQPPRLTITMLWALAGALLDIDWRDLPDHARRQLRQQSTTSRPPSSHSC